jgi:hypothetical protein
MAIKRSTNFKFPEVQLWLFGAISVGLGLGSIYSDLFKPYVLYLIVIGALVHLYGMYKVYWNK